MNAKLILKTLFVIVVLFLLVLMGMNNLDPVKFRLPPLITRAVEGKAAVMYFAFFALGFFTGTVLTAGGGGGSKGGGGGKSSQK
jgi:hypothetical protein